MPDADDALWHLGARRQAGLVSDRPEGRRTHYRAEGSALAPPIDWTGRITAFWRARFDRLDNLLGRTDQ